MTPATQSAQKPPSPPGAFAHFSKSSYFLSKEYFHSEDFLPILSRGRREFAIPFVSILILLPF